MPKPFFFLITKFSSACETNHKAGIARTLRKDNSVRFPSILGDILGNKRTEFSKRANGTYLHLFGTSMTLKLSHFRTFKAAAIIHFQRVGSANYLLFFLICIFLFDLNY